MADALIDALRRLLAARLPGLARSSSGVGLRAAVDAIYGTITLRLDWDAEAASIRIAAHLPLPPGGGHELLVWCLATNSQYWDVKLGLDDDGLLVVHADVDADARVDAALLAERLADRADTIRELIDEDLVPHLLARGLGTPVQRARWRERLAAQHDTAF
jgi:hypothetical protein